jgi:uncharacterized membrane protein YjgN (DUF898 family)
MAHEGHKMNTQIGTAAAATPKPGTVPPANPTTSAIPFQFTGSPREYFGIWIVNILVTIVTAGIYSAWAKVRTRRYFYGHTLLDGQPFEYDAKPLAILKGRVIVAMAVVVIVAVAYFRPMVLPLLWVLLGFAFPWLLVRSLKFNAFHSRYRGLRFAFNGTYRGALKFVLPAALLLTPGVGGEGFATWLKSLELSAGFIVSLLLGILILSLVFSAPYLDYLRRHFMITGHRYGTKVFGFYARGGDFYGIDFAAALVFGLAIAAGYALVLGPLMALTGGEPMSGGDQVSPGGPGSTPIPAHLAPLLGLWGMLSYLVPYAYYQSRVPNLLFNKTVIAGQRFVSTLGFWEMLWIYASNLVVMVLTLGLMVPWARVRMARYRCANLKLIAATSLDGFIADRRSQTGSQPGAVGDAMADVLDIDIGV